MRKKIVFIKIVENVVIMGIKCELLKKFKICGNWILWYLLWSLIVINFIMSALIIFVLIFFVLGEKSGIRVVIVFVIIK